MKLHDLHVLMSVAQAGGMGKAAKLLNTTQSAVSRSISELEHAVGVRLLDRNERGVEPTAFGRALLDGGAAVFDELRKAVEQIDFLTDPTVGKVRAGGSSAIVESLFPIVIARLYRRHPKLCVEVQQFPSGAAMHQNLRERKVDFIVGRTPAGVDNDLVAESLLPEPIYVVVGQQNRWAARRRVKLAELMDDPWVLTPPEAAPRVIMEEMFRAHGLEVPSPTVVTSSIALMHALVVTGPFITILPNSVVRFRINKPPLAIVHMETKAVQPLNIVTLKGRSLSPSAQLFVDCLKEVVKPVVKAR